MPRPRTECHFSLHIESGEIYSPKRFAPTDRILEPGPTLRFDLYYPFTNPKWVEETHADGTGWTEKQFVDMVQREYLLAYKEEGENPGHAEGTYNRKRSNGPYGIWGHDLCDLVLEGVYKNGDGSWGLCVGS